MPSSVLQLLPKTGHRTNTICYSKNSYNNFNSLDVYSTLAAFGFWGMINGASCQQDVAAWQFSVVWRLSLPFWLLSLMNWKPVLDQQHYVLCSNCCGSVIYHLVAFWRIWRHWSDHQQHFAASYCHFSSVHRHEVCESAMADTVELLAHHTASLV